MSHSAQPNVLTEAVRRCRGTFGTLALFSCCMNLLILAGPLYMLQVYDRVLSSGRVETLIMLTILLAAALMTWAALESLRTAVTVRLGAWFNQVLGPCYIDSGVRARLDGRAAGGQAFRDLSQIQSFMATNGMTAFFDIPWTPLFIAVIWMFHPWLGAFALASALLLLAVTFANEILTREVAAPRDGGPARGDADRRDDDPQRRAGLGDGPRPRAHRPLDPAQRPRARPSSSSRAAAAASPRASRSSCACSCRAASSPSARCW